MVSDTLYITYFTEIQFSREMDRDCCWDTRGGHRRRGNKSFAVDLCLAYAGRKSPDASLTSSTRLWESSLP
ncbi:hypothetical protein ALC53_00810 [Atta colombica]|uniref:Uncharacterized protein n=1 Tax=Atta colombica TaxID=520822 RepID=A0A195BVQ7_9HYME|nr:hypothetical protein ALC53_00810 [Atta colombica]